MITPLPPCGRLQKIFLPQLVSILTTIITTTFQVFMSRLWLFCDRKIYKLIYLNMRQNTLSSFSREKVFVLFPRRRPTGSVACTSFGLDKPFE